MAEFLGFVHRDGARYGGTVAVFQVGEDANRFDVDAMALMVRRHELRSAGVATVEENRALAGLRRCLDAQHWHDAERDFSEWLAERPMVEQSEAYLGDGVHASFDGHMIWLRTERAGGWHEIALGPQVFAALVEYAKRCFVWSQP